MRAKVDEKVKRQVVELRMEGLGAASVADRLGMKAETVAVNWKRWQRELGMEIPDKTKREIVHLIEEGANPDQAAAQAGVSPDTVMKWWRKWQKEIREELPEYLRSIVEAKVPDGEQAGGLTEAEMAAAESEETGESDFAESAAESKEEDNRMNRRTRAGETIELIRKIDELLTEYLESGKSVEAASIWIDTDNRFDLITEKREDSVYADLAVKIRVEK